MLGRRIRGYTRESYLVSTFLLHYYRSVIPRRRQISARQMLGAR